MNTSRGCELESDLPDKTTIKDCRPKCPVIVPPNVLYAGDTLASTAVGTQEDKT